MLSVFSNFCRLRDLSGSKFSTELNQLMSQCVKGECSDKVGCAVKGDDSV